MSNYNASDRHKLSPEFAAKLSQIEPEEKVRIIVLLRVEETENITGQRRSRGERKAAMQALRESAEVSLKKIDGIIKNFEGQALMDSPDWLGSMAIEITAAGVNALAESDAVKAIIEDRALRSALS